MGHERESFVGYYRGFFIRPRRTAEALVGDARGVRFGTFALLITVILYTLVYVFLILGGGRPTFKPWLAIPTESYYRFNVFLLAPSMFMGWILAAGVVQLLARRFSSTGSFEDTLGVLGFGIGIPSWSTLLHDLVTSFLGAVHVINQREFEDALNAPTFWRALLWFLMTLYAVWFVVAFAAGIGAAQRVRRGPAVILGAIGFVIYQGVLLIFIR